MAGAWLELDAVLRDRLQDVLHERRQPLTEAELRRLLEEGRACRLILGGELERLEQRLGKLDGDPSTSLGEIADAFRQVHEFRTHVDGLDRLLAELDDRAREVRGAWREHVAPRPGRDIGSTNT
jgi:hypothetical protein